MADLPRIFAEPNVTPYRAGPVSPDAFGSQFFGQLTEESYKIGQSVNVTTLQKAVEARDQLYQQQHIQMMQNPDAYNRMTPDQFAQQWTKDAQDGNKRILDNLPFFLRNHGEMFLYHLQRENFDKAMTQYNHAFLDRQAGDYIDGKAYHVQSILNAANEQDQAKNIDNLNGFISVMEHTRAISQEQGERDRVHLMTNVVPEGIAQNYINNLDFSGLDKFKQTGLFKGLSGDVQARVETREMRAWKRMNTEGIDADKATDNAWIDKNLDAILQNKDAAGTVNDFIKENRPFIKNGDIIFMRKRIGELLGTGKENSESLSSLEAEYEDERIPLGGLTSQALATKYIKKVDELGLDPTSSAKMKRQIVQDLQKANEIHQSQASAGRAATSFGQNQERSAVTKFVTDQVNSITMQGDPHDVKHWQDNKRNIGNDQKAIINQTLEEAGRTGQDWRPLAQQKIDAYKKMTNPPRKPAPSPEDKAILDILKNLPRK